MAGQLLRIGLAMSDETERLQFYDATVVFPHPRLPASTGRGSTLPHTNHASPTWKGPGGRNARSRRPMDVAVVERGSTEAQFGSTVSPTIANGRKVNFPPPSRIESAPQIICDKGLGRQDAGATQIRCTSSSHPVNALQGSDSRERTANRLPGSKMVPFHNYSSRGASDSSSASRPAAPASRLATLDDPSSLHHETTASKRTPALVWCKIRPRPNIHLLNDHRFLAHGRIALALVPAARQSCFLSFCVSQRPYLARCRFSVMFR